MATPKNYTPIALSVTNTFGAAFIPANPNRRALVIWNTTAGDLQFSIADTEVGLITIAAGNHVAWLDGAPQNKINLKAPGAVSAVAWEA